MKKLLKAWVLKRKYMDESGRSQEPSGTLLFFRDPPPEYGPAYEWIRMKHLDEREDDELGSSVGILNNPGTY